jgi:hypothetical protein
VNAAQALLELGQAALENVKEGEDSMKMEEMERLLALADEAFGTVREVLAMRGHYLTDAAPYGVEAAWQMAFLEEQIQDAVQ